MGLDNHRLDRAEKAVTRAEMAIFFNAMSKNLMKIQYFLPSNKLIFLIYCAYLQQQVEYLALFNEKFNNIQYLTRNVCL